MAPFLFLQGYTNDAEKLGEELSRDVSKQSALEAGHEVSGGDHGHATENAGHQSVSESHGHSARVRHGALIMDKGRVRDISSMSESTSIGSYCVSDIRTSAYRRTRA